MNLMGLDEHRAYNSGRTQICKYFLYFSVAIDPGKILATLWQEEGNFEALKRCYIHIYLNGVMEKLSIFNIRET